MDRFRTRLLLTLGVAGLCAGLAASAAALAPDDAKPIALFNGKDLDGWEGDTSLWSVKDGAITGTTTAEKPLKANQFLIWRGGTVKNFELKAKFRLVGNNNSGIQYRSKEFKDAGKFVVGGYQADIHPAPGYNGMLYDEKGRGIVAEAGQKVVVGPQGKKRVVGETEKPQPIKLDDWNDLTIVARGNHLVHMLNGRTTVDVVDHQESERELEGIVALQVHAGPPMTVQFKDLTLTPLPDGGLIAPGAEAKEAAGQGREAMKKFIAQSKPKGRGRPTGPAPAATPVERLKGLKDFKVELVYAVPREDQGSWVNMTADPKNRLIVSDQYGKLYRVTPAAVGAPASETKVEPIPAEIGEAQGLLWVFDSLSVIVNRGEKYDSGLYRVRDTDGDDQLDKVELLRKLDGGGEHGPHAVVLAPDGKSLYVAAGNATALTEVARSVVPRVWGEDNLLPNMPDGAGFMRDEKAPGGVFYRVDPDGKDWELVSIGFRNQYDMAFNRDGELFTYDSDMEWDMNLPWYRPTRVCQVVSGSDFGYRNGAGKFPPYYLDTLPATVDIGPGSPTGVAFGYGAKFPAKYQDAFYICDWSYGKLYAVHLTPRGASYSAEVEEFLTGTPLPLTDVVINPGDGAMYITVGGRRTTSALYRVTYAGPESTEASKSEGGSEARALRRSLEAFHGQSDPSAPGVAWAHLGHPDRFVRFAARVALEFQVPAAWRERALAERDQAVALPALLALVRVSAQDPAHRTGDAQPDTALRDRILKALAAIDWNALDEPGKLDLIRVYSVLFRRMGKPDTAACEAIAARFAPAFPARSRNLNAELAPLLVYLEAPGVAGKVLDLLSSAPTQEEQIDYARHLRALREGWTPELRKRYLEWFRRTPDFRGGNSLGGFLKQIREGALAGLSESERSGLRELIESLPQATGRGPAPAVTETRPHVKDWTLDELVPLVESGLKGRDFDKGRSLFAATQCFACHRFAGEGGGAGPELTGIAGRYSTRDLLEQVVHPSKVISDQYQAVSIGTSDGEVVTGRIVNLNGNGIMINTNMLDPNLMVTVDRSKIEEMKPSPVSMMPEGLLNTLDRDEVLDLMAYLLSRGDRKAPMFR